MTREEILEMKPGRELDELERKREYSQKYIHSEKGKETRKRWYEAHKRDHMEQKKLKRAEYATKNPEKIRIRQLIGNAVRKGYIPKPELSRDWYNRWEFHHPDYTRPFYGVWVSTSDHRLIENGKKDCPQCTDYTNLIIDRVCEEWGISKAALLAVMEVEE